MSIDFDNIFQHVIPMGPFRLKWHFTEEKYNKLPDQHLDQLKPWYNGADKFLWNFVAKKNLDNDIPSKKNFFRIIDKAKILYGNEKEIKEWPTHNSGFAKVGASCFYDSEMLKKTPSPNCKTLLRHAER
jgi:hypothetical protein